MWTIKKILVPTDFSDSSAAALQAAIELAQKFGAEIVLAHAYHLPSFPYARAARIAMTDIHADVDKSAREMLQATADAQASSGVRITTALYIGAPWEQIFRAATEHHVSLIVMGNRGLSATDRPFIGSTSESVVRCARVPVMTVHAPSPTPLDN